ncbi:hypothetical protein F2Q70_00019236 [Brassica cretica]|uniref:DUF4283 domain-containing protein n=1 Tax=Brassica cretica TaxID=69181 RepID=A0A8S9GSD8_BRACR|nr:hypothetical protein F2Q70_00019236 [Brassica cretica]
MPPKKKHKNALRGSTKMARLRAAAKPSISAKSLKMVSPLIGASVADAVTATSVVSTSDSAFKSEIEIAIANQVTVQTGSSSELPAAQVSTDSLVLGEDETTTPGVEVEAGVCPIQGTVQPPTEVEGRNYVSLLKDSAKLEEIGTPSEHVSGAPFVLIPDENIVSAREEFKEFIYARFHGEWPSMGRIIGVVNALWARGRGSCGERLTPDTPEEKSNFNVGIESKPTDPVPPFGEEACTNEEAVIEGSGEQSEYLKRETTFKQRGPDHNSRGRSVGSNQQSQAAAEKPFILVTGRKSGRKTKPSK